jgi:hypothetical protein
MNHRKSQRVAYRNGIRDFQSFDQSEIQKLSFFSAAILSSTDFSSVINAQNSVSFKLLVGWDCMSIQWKSGRVVKFLVFNLGEESHLNNPELIFLSSLQSAQK